MDALQKRAIEHKKWAEKNGLKVAMNPLLFGFLVIFGAPFALFAIISGLIVAYATSVGAGIAIIVSVFTASQLLKEIKGDI